MSSPKKSHSTKVIVTVTITILIGALITFIAIYIRETYSIPEGSLIAAFVELVFISGLTIVGVGIFNIILSMRDWKEYFEERIKKILFEQDYLNDLDKGTLKRVQINAFKAYFKNDDVDKEGGFLHYFNENLYKFISDPFRENVEATVVLEGEDNNGDYIITDTVLYQCRKSGSSIQDSIKWNSDKKEYVNILSINISIAYPSNHVEKGKTIELKNKIFNPPENDLQVNESLNLYSNLDGLNVIIKAKYTYKKEHFQYWQMAFPSKNFSISFVFPNTYRVISKAFVLSPEICIKTEGETYYSLRYPAWMLPQSGISWAFIKKQKANLLSSEEFDTVAT